MSNQHDTVALLGTCKNCKHWHAVHLYTGQTYHTCEAPEWVDSASYPVASDGFALTAGALDDTDLGVDLLTGPDFGCTRFAPDSRFADVLAELQNLFVLIDTEQLSEARYAIMELERTLGEGYPELTRARSLLRFLEGYTLHA